MAFLQWIPGWMRYGDTVLLMARLLLGSAFSGEVPADKDREIYAFGIVVQGRELSGNDGWWSRAGDEPSVACGVGRLAE
ncbi:hypothetical protein Cv017_10470 [Chromobacterium subtsugae]|nr:hypothetical protein Cv017_10470 [Chromobacterium subtsugae]